MENRLDFISISIIYSGNLGNCEKIKKDDRSTKHEIDTDGRCVAYGCRRLYGHSDKVPNYDFS